MTKAISKRLLNTSKDKQLILAFDQCGLIDVFQIKDIESHMGKLSISMEGLISVVDLANANILYQIASQLKLTPGESKASDEIIVDYISKKISLNVENFNDAVKEICESWNKFALYESSTQNKKPTTTDKNNLLQIHPNYEFNLNMNLVNIINILSSFGLNDPDMVLAITELVNSTLQGRPYSQNQYIVTQGFLDTAELYERDFQDSKEFIKEIKAKLERAQGRWFATVNGYVEMEIADAIDNDELDGNALRETLRDLVEGLFSTKDINKKIESALGNVIQFLKDPYKADMYKYLNDSATNKIPAKSQVIEAIQFAIFKTAKEKNCHFYSGPLPKKKSVLDLAGSNQSDEEQLLQQLLDEKQFFSSSILQNLLRKTSNEVTKDLIRSRLAQSSESDIYTGATTQTTSQTTSTTQTFPPTTSLTTSTTHTIPHTRPQTTSVPPMTFQTTSTTQTRPEKSNSEAEHFNLSEQEKEEKLLNELLTNMDAFLPCVLEILLNKTKNELSLELIKNRLAQLNKAAPLQSVNNTLISSTVPASLTTQYKRKQNGSEPNDSNRRETIHIEDSDDEFTRDPKTKKSRDNGRKH